MDLYQQLFLKIRNAPLEEETLSAISMELDDLHEQKKLTDKEWKSLARYIRDSWFIVQSEHARSL